MDDAAPPNYARRRSSSMLSVPGPAGAKRAYKKHRRTQSERFLQPHDETPPSETDPVSDSSNKSDSTDLELDDMHSGSTDDDAGLEDDEETGLTTGDRRKRRRRKRRNTRLDQRIVDDGRPTRQDDKLASQSFVHSVLINVLLIGLWYLFSISISVYNKWMFKMDKGDGQTEHIFPYPLFSTCLHMIVQFSLASLVLFLIPSYRPRHDSISNSAASPPRADEKRPLMTNWFYLTRIGPCGAATGMDIGLGNTSLKFISLTFFTMCKSSALGFVLLFAFLFRLEKPSWKLVVIILIMTMGVVMMVAGETAFDALGFILVMSSACSSGFRWSLTQILLLRNPATSNPFSSIFFLAPVMFLSLLVLAVPVEGFTNVADGLVLLMDARGPVLGLSILLFPGVLAFLMTSSEFALLKRTSVVTLSICGIFKEVVTITTANFVFNDQLTPINLSGLVITIGSIAAYNYMKIKKMRDEHRLDAQLTAAAAAHAGGGTGDGYTPVLNTDPDAPSTTSPSTTRELIRNSLNLTTANGIERALVDSPARASPVKRPEDLE